MNPQLLVALDAATQDCSEEELTVLQTTKTLIVRVKPKTSLIPHLKIFTN
uniref:Predicted protein n=1 Tax=Hordeum vulgare subsp. vulgare TaxID=112509 RepID=F2DFJ0_HORVV|nr:predicted protein [Hordeum vulgare subsp. vulgare]